ncbi:MAG: class I SAM-dependent methyltransferase [Rhodospirillales bacterium]|nr:class I SAM-dependent methyltransferase [Rhodospirillales bacterium]
MHEVYEWAYVNPFNVYLLDRDWVVDTILFGNNGRLVRAFLKEISPGQRVLQSAHVYGDVIPKLATKIGPAGFLDIIDVVPVQADHAREKVKGMDHVRVRIADAADPGDDLYDVVSCFFLLHELPSDKKRAAVDALLDRVGPGGKAVFVDYHNPHRFHPLRWLLAGVFAWLEPFAAEMWQHAITDFAARAGDFRWQTKTFFGGLYQVTVATRS